MGTWDFNAFGNDDACDWSYGLKNTTDLSLVDSTLRKVSAAGSSYLEAPESCEALAAAEVIARLQGNFGAIDPYTEIADDWVRKLNKRPSTALCQMAHHAIDRILSEPSELLELWQETDEFELWKQAVLGLKARILVTADDK